MILFAIRFECVQSSVCACKCVEYTLFCLCFRSCCLFGDLQTLKDYFGCCFALLHPVLCSASKHHTRCCNSHSPPRLNFWFASTPSAFSNSGNLCSSFHLSFPFELSSVAAQHCAYISSQQAGRQVGRQSIHKQTAGGNAKHSVPRGRQFHRLIRAFVY